MTRMRTYLLVIGMAASLGACRTSSSVTDTAPPPETEEVVMLSDYETFDASPYRDEPAQIDTSVEHDVPASLLEGEADRGVTRQVRGYRVQVFSGTDPEEAIAVEESIISWLSSLSDEELRRLGLSRNLATYNVFMQPYYRVRIGDFASRNGAMALEAELERRYPGAFIVPDTVTLRR